MKTADIPNASAQSAVAIVTATFSALSNRPRDLRSETSDSPWVAVVPRRKALLALGMASSRSDA
jgi:hypothetical protein